MSRYVFSQTYACHTKCRDSCLLSTYTIREGHTRGVSVDETATKWRWQLSKFNAGWRKRFREWNYFRLRARAPLARINKWTSAWLLHDLPGKQSSCCLSCFISAPHLSYLSTLSTAPASIWLPCNPHHIFPAVRSDSLISSWQRNLFSLESCYPHEWVDNRQEHSHPNIMSSM